MAKKKQKKIEDVLIDYCLEEDYDGNYIAMAEDSIRPEYTENAS